MSAIIALSSVSVVMAGNPYWKCFYTFVTVECDWSCNCQGPVANCCLEWRNTGGCGSCLYVNEYGWDQCKQDPNPPTTAGQFRMGDCAYAFEIEYTKDCSECANMGTWVNGNKRCDTDCGS